MTVRFHVQTPIPLNTKLLVVYVPVWHVYTIPVLTVRGMKISCPDKASLTEVWLYLLSVSVKLSLAAMFELNVEDNKSMLHKQNKYITSIMNMHVYVHMHIHV